jgi:protein-S-isoprenylcysteine O-methyltransferase Ste14
VPTEPDSLARLGGWLFRHRTLLPLPVAAAILTLPAGPASPSTLLVASGVAVSTAGEALRVWGVHHIGAISRTRSDRLGPLVLTGPFARVRNPLYIGNVLLWAGFALAARVVWLAPAIVVFLGLEYHAIVRWEERLLEARLGAAYRAYAARVPRWMPVLISRGAADAMSGTGLRRDAFSWRETLFSERGTFVAIVCGYLLLWIKARF